MIKTKNPKISKSKISKIKNPTFSKIRLGASQGGKISKIYYCYNINSRQAGCAGLGRPFSNIIVNIKAGRAGKIITVTTTTTTTAGRPGGRV